MLPSDSYDRSVSNDSDGEQAPISEISLERFYEVGPSQLMVRFGDLTTSSADVIVSSDDYLLSAGGGVSGAIARAGGHAIRIETSKFDPLTWGDVVVTTAGALPAKYVFHAVTIGPPDDASRPLDAQGQMDMIAASVARCMELARTLGVSSIAFPALGTGVANLDRAVVAAAMADVIATDLASHADALRVEIHLAAKRWQTNEEYIVFFEEFAARVRAPIAPVVEPVIEAPPRPVPELVRLQQELVAWEGGDESTQSVEHLVELQRRIESVARQEQPIQVFVSYAREDESAALVLTSHLAALRHERLAVWSDQRIEPGEKWDEKIREAIETADIGVYLVSHWFLSSDYCVGVEWKRALERVEEGTMRMLPVILSRCHWQSLVGHIQVMPPGGEPISRQADPDDAYFDIVAEVMRMARTIQASRA